MRTVAFLLIYFPPAWCADPTWLVPPLTTRIDVQGQPLEVTVSGTLAAAPSVNGQEAIRVKLDADLADLQRNLTPLLAARLNQSNRCGERLSVERATLVPEAPTGLLTAQVHFEKWGCVKAFGKEVVKKLVTGEGTVGVKLTPEVTGGNTLRLAADVTSIDATGPVGDLLRSGSLGDAVREKIRDAVLSALQKSTDLQAALPGAVQEIAAIRGAEFRDGGEGRLVLSVESEIRMSEEQARTLLERWKPAGVGHVE